MNKITVGEIADREVEPVQAPIYPTTLAARERPSIEMEDFMTQAAQSILDNRLGIDKEKLKEIEAMMEEVANDENLSPEQKEKKLAELQELYEEVIEESVKRLEMQTTERNEELLTP